LEKNSKLKFIIISPNASETLDEASTNDFEGIDEYMDRLLIVEEYFNKDFNINNLKEIIK
jgi:hypothetical protein